jgi:hypothetical protein
LAIPTTLDFAREEPELAHPFLPAQRLTKALTRVGGRTFATVVDVAKLREPRRTDNASERSINVARFEEVTVRRYGTQEIAGSSPASSIA